MAIKIPVYSLEKMRIQKDKRQKNSYKQERNVIMNIEKKKKQKSNTKISLSFKVHPVFHTFRVGK